MTLSRTRSAEQEIDCSPANRVTFAGDRGAGGDEQERDGDPRILVHVRSAAGLGDRRGGRRAVSSSATAISV
jgi:hypothetical protein